MEGETIQGLGSDLMVVTAFAALIAANILLVAGAKRKVVIYFNIKDMSISFLGVYLPFISILAFGTSPFSSSLFNGLWHGMVAPAVLIAGVASFMQSTLPVGIIEMPPSECSWAPLKCYIQTYEKLCRWSGFLFFLWYSYICWAPALVIPWQSTIV